MTPVEILAAEYALAKPGRRTVIVRCPCSVGSQPSKPGRSHATATSRQQSLPRCPRIDARPPDSHPGERRSRGRVWRRPVVPMPEAVMGRAANSEIPRLGAAAKREGNDVVELQQEAGPAAAPAVRIDVAAAAAVAAPHLAPHRCGNVAGSTRPAGRLRAARGRAGCLWLRPRTAIKLRRSCPLRRRRSAATTIRYCQRGGHALVGRRCRPWRRYGGVGPQDRPPTSPRK